MKNITVNQIITLNSIVKFITESYSASEIAKNILNEIMIFRRLSTSINACKDLNCAKCSSPHLSKIITAVKKNKPITFVLPAFPGKSPNPEKVLGYLPDYAEQLSLNFLENLCQRIKKFYNPGVKIILCSDGRVFSDVVGMKENHVTAYQIELNKLIKKISFSNISTFNLENFYGNINFNQMRNELMKSYGESLDSLKYKVGTEQEFNQMYCGITRFLFEDTQYSKYSEQTKSRTALLKESRIKAYEVIRRSQAWSQLIAEQFPEAVRLSIHPQTCGAKKLAIRLIGKENWMTPWHGVAVEGEKGYILMKRSEAEALGAQLVHSQDGRPSHFDARSIL